MNTTVFAEHLEIVAPETTAAGHLTVGNFLSLFDRATDTLRAALGLGPDYAARMQRGLVVAEVHLVFLQPAAVGARIRVHSRLLGAAPKRLHVFHEARADSNYDLLFATNELALVHADRLSGRGTPFPDDLLSRLEDWAARQACLPFPEQVGRAVRALEGGAVGTRSSATT